MPPPRSAPPPPLPLTQLVEVRHVRPEWQFLGVKSSKDTRYGHHWIATHDSRCVRCVAAHSLAEFKAHLGPRWNKLHVSVGGLGK